MTEPSIIQERNLDLISDTIQIFISRIPKAAEYYLSDTVTKDKIEKLLNDWKLLSSKSNSLEDLVQEIASEIFSYTSYYRVDAVVTIDEFKAIFFCGTALGRFCRENGMTSLSHVFLHTMITLLDLRINFTFDTYRKKMSRAIHVLVDDNNIETHTGKYGIYLTYKGMHNFKREGGERNPSSPRGWMGAE